MYLFPVPICLSQITYVRYRRFKTTLKTHWIWNSERRQVATLLQGQITYVDTTVNVKYRRRNDRRWKHIGYEILIDVRFPRCSNVRSSYNVATTSRTDVEIWCWSPRSHIQLMFNVAGSSSAPDIVTTSTYQRWKFIIGLTTCLWQSIHLQLHSFSAIVPYHPGN